MERIGHKKLYILFTNYFQNCIYNSFPTNSCNVNIGIFVQGHMKRVRDENLPLGASKWKKQEVDLKGAHVQDG